MGFHQTSWLLLLVTVGATVACDLYTPGPCDEQCGGGNQHVITRMCNSSAGESYPCRMSSVSCNTAPCDDEFSEWSECSAACGYGVKTRSNQTGEVQTMSCNLKACGPVDCADGAADIVFVVDKSASITDYGFEILKQLISDVVSMLPAGGSVRVAMVSFSVQASTVFEFTNNPSVSNILGDQFTGGTGINAYGLKSAADLFGSSVNVPKIAVILTDGEQMILEACTNELAQVMQQSGVKMFSVGIGSGTLMSLNPFTSMPFTEHQFRAGFNSTATKLANAILNITCGQSNLLTVIEDDMSADNPNMAGLQQAGPSNQRCDPWTDWTPCSETCGASGRHNRNQRCTDEKGETITNFDFGDCFVVCPTTTTTTTTTTTIPPTTTTMPSPEPDCTRCDYTKGQIWLPDSQNCHDYYICEKVDTWGGRWYWTYHHVSCGLLYWDQSRLTCTPMIQPGCEEQIPVVVEQPDLSGAECPYEAVVGRPREYCSKVDGSVQECIKGMMFEPLICACLQVSEIDPICSDDLLLYFPYDVDFDDVTCHHAKGYAYGDGVASIVNDPERGRVVCFDGNVRIEVPFMRNWFKDQCTTRFTVMLWVKRSAANGGRVGIVHNGDCVDPPTFLIYGDEGGAGNEVLSGLDTDGFPLTFSESVPIDDAWHHVAMVYDGRSMTMYVDSKVCTQCDISGFIDNRQNPMMIGALGCCQDKMGFFEGCMDDLRIYTRALSAAEVASDAAGDFKRDR